MADSAFFFFFSPCFFSLWKKFPLKTIQKTLFSDYFIELKTEIQSTLNYNAEMFGEKFDLEFYLDKNEK